MTIAILYLCIGVVFIGTLFACVYIGNKLGKASGDKTVNDAQLKEAQEVADIATKYQEPLAAKDTDVINKLKEGTF